MSYSQRSPTRDRTWDIQINNLALHHLSYRGSVGPVGFDPTTLRLRGGCSDQLSYGPLPFAPHDREHVTSIEALRLMRNRYW